MSFIRIDISNLDSLLSLLDESAKDENMQRIAEKGLSEGFKLHQGQIRSDWTHEKTDDKERKRTKKKTIEYLLYDDTPLWRSTFATLGTGFMFDNTIDPNSPQAVGGIIAQYLAYGTKKNGKQVISPDDRLKAAIAGKAIKDKVNKRVEEACIEEFERIFEEL